MEYTHYAPEYTDWLEQYEKWIEDWIEFEWRDRLAGYEMLGPLDIYGRDYYSELEDVQRRIVKAWAPTVYDAWHILCLVARYYFEELEACVCSTRTVEV